MASARNIQVFDNDLVVSYLEEMTVYSGRIWTPSQKPVCESVPFLTYKRLVICLALSLFLVVLIFATADSKKDKIVLVTNVTYDPTSKPSESPSHLTTPTLKPSHSPSVTIFPSVLSFPSISSPHTYVIWAWLGKDVDGEASDDNIG